MREGNAYAPQLLNPPTLLPPVTTAYDAPTQAHVIDAEADVLKVNTTRGTTFIAKTDPQDAAAESNRKLAMRLLRAAIQQVGGQANRLPTARDLGWSPASWVKVVSVLKPHVVAKEGERRGNDVRGGVSHVGGVV